MSKNITILEDGEAKSFGSVKKLQTNEVGGGTCTWVPEDEAGDYANYEELSVTENGTYRPSENVDGFSKVEVDVLPELEDIEITRNGVYKSSKYGYGRVEVDVQGGGDAETGSITITENGTYYASDEELDGFDEVIVDVMSMNINGTTTVQGKVMSNLSAGDTVYFTASASGELTPITNTGMQGTLFAIGERFAWTYYNGSVLVYRLTTVPASLYKTIAPTMGGTMAVNGQYGGANGVVIQENVGNTHYLSLYANDDPDTSLGTVEYFRSGVSCISITVSSNYFAVDASSKVGFYYDSVIFDFENGTYASIGGDGQHFFAISDGKVLSWYHYGASSSSITPIRVYNRDGELYGITYAELPVSANYSDMRGNAGIPKAATVGKNIVILCPNSGQNVLVFYLSDIISNVGNTSQTPLAPFSTFERPEGFYGYRDGYYVEIDGYIYGTQMMGVSATSLFWGEASNPTENSMSVTGRSIISNITSSYILLSDGNIYLSNSENIIQPANNTIHGGSRLGVVLQAYSAGDTGTATIIFG